MILSYTMIIVHTYFEIILLYFHTFGACNTVTVSLKDIVISIIVIIYSHDIYIVIRIFYIAHP